MLVTWASGEQRKLVDDKLEWGIYMQQGTNLDHLQLKWALDLRKLYNWDKGSTPDMLHLERVSTVWCRSAIKQAGTGGEGWGDQSVSHANVHHHCRHHHREEKDRGRKEMRRCVSASIQSLASPSLLSEVYWREGGERTPAVTLEPRLATGGAPERRAPLAGREEEMGREGTVDLPTPPLHPWISLLGPCLSVTRKYAGDF